MLRLYDYLESGNGYKVRLLLHQLGIPFERIELDIVKGETRTPAFLAKNPNGRIPTLELEDGTCLPESNAILWYLAEGTPFLRAYEELLLACAGIPGLRVLTGDEADAVAGPGELLVPAPLLLSAHLDS